MNQPEVLIWEDPVDPQTFLRPPSQQSKIYEGQRRQAKWAFNICVAFAVFGIMQVVVGLLLAIFDRQHGASTPVGLLASGGVFGTLFNWGSKLSQSANVQLERIARHEKARDLIASISDRPKRDDAILAFAKSLHDGSGKNTY